MEVKVPVKVDTAILACCMLHYELNLATVIKNDAVANGISTWTFKQKTKMGILYLTKKD